MSEFKPFQWDGCGCTWYENEKKERKLMKCDLHEKSPMAFGGISFEMKKNHRFGVTQI